MENTDMNWQGTSWIGMDRVTVARALSQFSFKVDRKCRLNFDYFSPNIMNFQIFLFRE